MMAYGEKPKWRVQLGRRVENALLTGLAIGMLWVLSVLVFNFFAPDQYDWPSRAEAIPVERAVKREAPSVLADPRHDCEYVVVSDVVFCWRGTNLLAVGKSY